MQLIAALFYFCLCCLLSGCGSDSEGGNPLDGIADAQVACQLLLGQKLDGSFIWSACYITTYEQCLIDGDSIGVNQIHMFGGDCSEDGWHTPSGY